MIQATRLSLISCLLALLALAIAVPVSHGDRSAIHASSLSKAGTSSLWQKPSSTALMASSTSTKPTATVAAYACPTKQFKQCCQSVNSASKSIIEPLGKLVPIIGGLQISSAITLQCRHSSLFFLCTRNTKYTRNMDILTGALLLGKHMKDDAYPDSCNNGSTAMCCNSQAQVRRGDVRPGRFQSEDEC